MKEVRPPKRPLIFYYCVAVLILLLFNFLAMPWLAQRQIQEVDYNTFVEMLEDGQVVDKQVNQRELDKMRLARARELDAAKYAGERTTRLTDEEREARETGRRPRRKKQA